MLGEEKHHNHNNNNHNINEKVDILNNPVLIEEQKNDLNHGDADLNYSFFQPIVAIYLPFPIPRVLSDPGNRKVLFIDFLNPGDGGFVSYCELESFLCPVNNNGNTVLQQKNIDDVPSNIVSEVAKIFHDIDFLNFLLAADLEDMAMEFPQGIEELMTSFLEVPGPNNPTLIGQTFTFGTSSIEPTSERAPTDSSFKILPIDPSLETSQTNSSFEDPDSGDILN
jgi:hypothetical protein